MAADLNLKTRIALRNDVAANWTASNPTLLKGEIGIEIDTLKFKIGDGTKKWATLQYVGVGTTEINAAIAKALENVSNVYDIQKSVLSDSDEKVIKAKVTELNADTTFKKGDFFIISTAVDAKTYDVTGYIVASKPATNDEAGVWAAVKALNGNVDADKVILKSNITLAGDYTSVGNVKLSENTFSTKGKSVAEALTQIFTKKLQPSITAQPAVSGFSLTGAKAVEAGTKIAEASFGTATLSAGSYKYGPATGITATAWKVDRVCVVPTGGTALSKESVATTTSGKDDNDGNGFIIGDVKGDNVVSSLKYTITATHGAGAVAKDNLGGTSSPEVKIAAGTKSQTTQAYTPFRQFFYGATTDKPEINSTYVRTLTGSGKAYTKGEYTLTVSPGSTRVCIACISGTVGVTKVINTSALNANVTDTFTKSQVSVAGVDGYAPIEYNIWTYEPATAYGQQAVLKVTLG